MDKIDVRQLMEDPIKGREFIRDGVTLDIKAAIYTLNTVLHSSEMLEAYVETQWRRYVAFYEAEKAQQNLFEGSNVNGKGHAVQ